MAAPEIHRHARTPYHQNDDLLHQNDGEHYLGKETVQNILVLRFANGLFEPIWNRSYVDHVQVLVGETVGVENLGNEVGAGQEARIAVGLAEERLEIVVDARERSRSRAVQLGSAGHCADIECDRSPLGGANRGRLPCPQQFLGDETWHRRGSARAGPAGVERTITIGGDLGIVTKGSMKGTLQTAEEVAVISATWGLGLVATVSYLRQVHDTEVVTSQVLDDEYFVGPTGGVRPGTHRSGACCADGPLRPNQPRTHCLCLSRGAS